MLNVRPPVAVLLYPGCIFFEVAAATEMLAATCSMQWFTPDGGPHRASNGSTLLADGSYQALEHRPVAAVLVPGGNPDSVIAPGSATACLRAAAEGGALIAGICAGALVLARAGLLVGRRATHNYTLAHTTADVVACTAPIFRGIVYEEADIVVDGRFVTAQHWAHQAFADTVVRLLAADAAAVTSGGPVGRH